jgi:hypothetical protein
LADPVPVKGKSGTTIEFEIQKVTATNFVGVRKDNGQTLTIPWDKVDLDWLKANQPDLYKSYTDAAAAAPAPAPDAGTAAAAPAADGAPKRMAPSAIATQLVTVWRMNTAQLRASHDSSNWTYGTHTRDYRLTLRAPAKAGKGGPGGPGGQGGQGNRGGGPGGQGAAAPVYSASADATKSNFTLIKLISDTNKAGASAYTDFVENKAIREAMTSDVEAAVMDLQEERKGPTFGEAVILINSGQTFLEAMNNISQAGTTVRRDALDNLQSFVDIWSRYAPKPAPAAKAPAAAADSTGN